VIAWIEELFGDNVTGVVVLSTIHKSKGREWTTVYWLNRAQTCPSRYATLPWMQEQERNLCYVAATRAMKELIEIEYTIG
jgi:DNA helicase II / ATP-dependent DNA helicase PcrA